MKRKIKICVHLAQIIVILCIISVGCGAKTPDYSVASDFETALNNVEDTIGKIVSFEVVAVIPESQFGFNIWSGDHLNFCSEEKWNVQRGDVLTVKIRSVSNVGDSYIIRYKMLSEVEKGYTEQDASPNPFGEGASDLKTLIANSVHTAFLTAVMDPEVVNQEDYDSNYALLKGGMEITEYSGPYKMGENSIFAAAAEILDVESFNELADMLQSSEATGRIYVTAIGDNKMRVEIEGTGIVVE